MLLDLGGIINVPGEAVPFEESFDFSELEFGAARPASRPVLARGEVRNSAGALVISGEISTVLHCVCDRCLESFEEPFSLKIDALAASELSHEENDDSVFLLEGENLDLDEVITTLFVLNMQMKSLCSPDCLGLCSGCGANLNDGPCDCGEEADPRFAALRQLLENGDGKNSGHTG